MIQCYKTSYIYTIQHTHSFVKIFLQIKSKKENFFINTKKSKKIFSFLILLFLFILGSAYATYDPQKREVHDTVVKYYEFLKTQKGSDEEIQKIFDMNYYKDRSKFTTDVQIDHFKDLKVESYKIKKIKKMNKENDIYAIDMYLNTSSDVGDFTIYCAKMDGQWYMIFGQHNIPDEFLK